LALKDDTELRELIRKTALLNAAQHGGKAQAGALIGKIIGERQELKTKATELSALISEVVNEVNRLPAEEQKSIIEKNWPEALKKETAEE
jgi:glutamyl-tRNA synthetase